MNNQNRNITWKDLAEATFVVVFLFGGLVIANLYSNAIGLFLMAIPIVFGIFQFLTIPKDEKKAVGKAMKKHDEKPIVKLLKIIQYIVLALILLYFTLSCHFSKSRSHTERELSMENYYIQQCKELSLTARMTIALLIFERYCQVNRIEDSKLVTEFIDYLWKWPLIDGPDQFDPWQQSHTELVSFGLGLAATKELESVLESANVDQTTFREIVSGVVAILWESFWGGSEDELSLQALNNVIKASKLSELPRLTPFKFSRFSEMSGWGVKISLEDREYWRHCFEYT